MKKCIAYKWDMEKIIIVCNAKYLEYEFPKRKWYQWLLGERTALIRLPFAREDELEMDILMQVEEIALAESASGDFIRTMFEEANEYVCFEHVQVPSKLFVHPVYISDVCKKILKQCVVKKISMENVIVLDYGNEELPDFLELITDNSNFLTILTEHPYRYEHVLERIENENGLVAMVFGDSRQLIKYLKQNVKRGSAFVVAADGPKEEVQVARRKKEGNNWNSLLYHLPKKSFFVDFCCSDIFSQLILRKRMRFNYVSIPIFLDNTAKNRYNAVVNEGITFQVINKNFWRRKGNRDGRKEEYSDLRRSEKIRR